MTESEYIPQLCQLGYFVLQPNYRGSTGYGKLARRRDRRDWGGGDYNDVFSGAAGLIAAGRADPSKIVHVGWSCACACCCWLAPRRFPPCV